MLTKFRLKVLICQIQIIEIVFFLLFHRVYVNIFCLICVLFSVFVIHTKGVHVWCCSSMFCSTFSSVVTNVICYYFFFVLLLGTYTFLPVRFDRSLSVYRIIVVRFSPLQYLISVCVWMFVLCWFRSKGILILTVYKLCVRSWFVL